MAPIKQRTRTLASVLREAVMRRKSVASSEYAKRRSKRLRSILIDSEKAEADKAIPIFDSDSDHEIEPTTRESDDVSEPTMAAPSNTTADVSKPTVNTKKPPSNTTKPTATTNKPPSNTTKPTTTDKPPSNTTKPATTKKPSNTTNHSTIQSEPASNTPNHSTLQSSPIANDHESQTIDPPLPRLDEVNLPNTEYACNEPIDHQNSQEANSTNLRRIRLRESLDIDGNPLKSGRGVCNGAKLEAAIRANKGCRLELEKGSDGKPVYGTNSNLLTHAVGMIVKEHVRMDVPHFNKLGPQDLQSIMDHITAFFVVNKEDKWLEDYILSVAGRRFRGWKSSIHKHYQLYGPDIPYEFKERPEQWSWLCNVFESSEFKKISERNAGSRHSDNHMTYCGGKKSFNQIAEEYINTKDQAPILSTIKKVYGKDPKGSKLVEKMQERMIELQKEREEVGSNEEISVQQQLDIINEIKGKRKCTGESSINKKGKGALKEFRAVRELQEELEKTRQEREREREEAEAFKREILASFKALEQRVSQVDGAASTSAPAAAPSLSTQRDTPSTSGTSSQATG